jgi:hypothetical protein
MAKAEAADIPDGMSMPDELARREERLHKLSEARTKIEARAKERYSPRSSSFARKAISAFHELRSVALNPAHYRRVRKINVAFGHHLDEIRETQFEPEIPANAKNDDLPVEMASHEKPFDAQHVDPHPPSAFDGQYARLPLFAPEPFLSPIVLNGADDAMFSYYPYRDCPGRPQSELERGLQRPGKHVSKRKGRIWRDRNIVDRRA